MVLHYKVMSFKISDVSTVWKIASILFIIHRVDFNMNNIPPAGR